MSYSFQTPHETRIIIYSKNKVVIYPDRVDLALSKYGHNFH